MLDALRGVAFASQISAAAVRHHLDPRLLAAVAAQETGGPGARSGANILGDGGHGHGVFQIDDRFHEFARSGEAMDPAKNADYAAGLLAEGLRRYGDVRKALSAYNAGDPNAGGTRTTWADGKTLGYADSVLRHLRELGAGGALPGGAKGVIGGPEHLRRDESMGFNWGQAVMGALPGALTGNWAMAAAGGIKAGANGGQTATSAVGNTGNAELDALLALNSAQQTQNMAQQMAWNQQMQQQAEAFNEMTDEKSEMMREGNVLRDISMQQRKADNQITKEFIQMIKD